MKIYYPKPEILQHVPMDGHVIMEASAGTGKTYTLEHLVIELLLGEQDVELEQILVVTFTEKATSELKVRVRKVIKSVLDAAALARRDPHSKYLVPLDPEQQPHWVIDDEQRHKLERAHLAFDIAPIYTIHAFCQKILTEYAFANQRMFDQQHVEFGQLFERAFTDTMRRTLARDSALQDWLEAWLETSSVEELQRLMAQVVTSRAEIWPRFREDRLAAGLERFGDDLWSRYREVYRRRCDRREVAFKRAQSIWTATRSVPRFLMHADAEVIDFKHSMREVRIENEEQQDFLKFTVALTRFKPAVAQKFQPIMQSALEREKQRTGAYTFDDMLDMFWHSLCREGSGEWLARTLRRRYRYALIDEFQDTDETQWKIFRKLFTQGPEKRERLFVIGDPKQAIYGFRNADVHTYLGAQDELLTLDGPANDDMASIGANTDEEKNPLTQGVDKNSVLGDVKESYSEDVVHGNGSVLLRLRHNYRSTPRLIDGYNTILDQTHSSPFFSGDEINYAHPVKCGDPMRAVRDPQGREPAAIVIGQMKRRDHEQHKTSRMDDLYECYGKWIAEEIAHLLSPEGALTFEKGGEARVLGASDMFILTRTCSDEYKIEKYLRAANIPHVFVRQESLFASPQAQEVYDVLRAIERPRDRSRRLRAWSTAFFAIDLDDLTRCREVSETHALYKSLLHWHVLAKEQRFEELFTDLLERSGLVRREIFFGEDMSQMAEYHQLIDVLLEEAHLGRCDIHELVARMRAFIEGQRKPLVQHGDIKRMEEHEDAVQILTMHKSKGLEAPIVFLYPFGGMGGDAWRFHYPDRQGETVRALHIHKPEEKISPKLRKRVEAEDRQESERLLYVAMTRAEARLYIPFVPYIGEQPCCKSIAQRSYSVLNHRLRDLVGDLETGAVDEEGDGEDRTGWRENFELRDIPYFGMMPVIEETDAELIDLISKWKPPTRLLEAREAAAEQRSNRDHKLLSERVQHMESYSSLKRRAGGYQLADAPIDEQEMMADAELGSVEDAVGEEDLPGGVRTGLFLHAMLEELDYSSLTRFQGVEEWQCDGRVVGIFKRCLKEYGIEPRYLELSQRLIWRALTAVVEVEHGVIYGLGHCIPNIRELEFMYPIPDGATQLSLQGLGERTSSERGFLKGYIDYTFEWQDRVYFADWKSDVLDRYDTQSLRQHFEMNYTKQAFLYTIALCKMFDVQDEASYTKRFGGAVYCFLRGMQEDSRTGHVSWRPTWGQVLEFEHMLSLPDLGQTMPQIPAWAQGSVVS